MKRKRDKMFSIWYVCDTEPPYNTIRYDMVFYMTHSFQW